LHSSNSPDFQDAFNFSNPENSGVSVRRLLEFFPSDLGLKIENHSQNTIYPEAKFLNLNSEKSKIKLMWHPVMSVPEAMRKTIEWYLNYMNGTDMRDFTIAQIKEYIDREPH
jgi:CDP-glucose 4,6-dehydratase